MLGLVVWIWMVCGWYECVVGVWMEWCPGPSPYLRDALLICVVWIRGGAITCVWVVSEGLVCAVWLVVVSGWVVSYTLPTALHITTSLHLCMCLCEWLCVL